jgi:hypothetical protein
VPLPRAGFAFTAGFPLQLLTSYERQALEQGWMVAEVRERGCLRSDGCVSRRAVALFLPKNRAFSEDEP